MLNAGTLMRQEITTSVQVDVLVPTPNWGGTGVERRSKLDYWRMEIGEIGGARHLPDRQLIEGVTILVDSPLSRTLNMTVGSRTKERRKVRDSAGVLESPACTSSATAVSMFVPGGSMPSQNQIVCDRHASPLFQASCLLFLLLFFFHFFSPEIQKLVSYSV